MITKIHIKNGLIVSAALLALHIAAFTSCNSDEDTTPSLADQNVFIPAADDQSPTAQLRREFFQQTGSYLLFTDTLLSVQNDKTVDDTKPEKTELLDVMGYSLMGFGSSTRYFYDYITQPDSQRLAADLVRQHLVRRLGKAQPFAYLLVNAISHYNNSKLVSDVKLIGMRAYAISVPPEAYTSPDVYFRSMLNDIVTSKVTSLSDVDLAAFLAFSGAYYIQDEDHFGLNPNQRTPDETMWEYGFFTDVYYSMFPNQAYDLSNWVAAVLRYGRGEFEAIYGSSQMMMNKYDALRSIIEDDLGYILD